MPKQELGPRALLACQSKNGAPFGGNLTNLQKIFQIFYSTKKSIKSQWTCASNCSLITNHCKLYKGAPVGGLLQNLQKRIIVLGPLRGTRALLACKARMGAPFGGNLTNLQKIFQIFFVSVTRDQLITVNCSL